MITLNRPPGVRVVFTHSWEVEYESEHVSIGHGEMYWQGKVHHDYQHAQHYAFTHSTLDIGARVHPILGHPFLLYSVEHDTPSGV